jgi:cell division transport system permease protein
MPKPRTIAYSLGQGFAGLGRNKMFTIASISTISACLFLFGIFYFVLINFTYVLHTAESNVSITIFFEADTNESDIAVVGTYISGLSGVDTVRYVSSQEAWERYKAQYLTPEVAVTFGDDNPLKDSASLEVTCNEIAKQANLVLMIKNLPAVRLVNSSEQAADIFSGINTVVTYVSSGIIILLLCVAAFLISVTVSTGVSVRKTEISIMKLIGASDYFIRAPFVIEGVLIGIMGSCVPLVILYLIYNRVMVFVSTHFANVFHAVSFATTHEIFTVLTPISFIIGIGIGYLGSRLTVVSQLRKIE